MSSDYQLSSTETSTIELWESSNEFQLVFIDQYEERHTSGWMSTKQLHKLKDRLVDMCEYWPLCEDEKQ